MKFVDRLSTLGLLLLGIYSGSLSPLGRSKLGRRIAMLLKLDKKRLDITRDNVAHAFPELSDEKSEDIVQGAYNNLGITLAELLAIPKMDENDLLDRISIPGIEMVHERSKQGKASILVSGHYGNWEYLAMAAGVEVGVPITIVAHPQKNDSADKKLNEYRTKFGNKIVPMSGAARPLVSAMKSGGVVAFLVDQHANSDSDPHIEYFGRKTPTYEAPAALALRYDVPIFYAFAERQPDGRYFATLSRLRMDDLGTDKDSTIELTKRHVQALEEAVRKRPELWSWQHRRWRE